MQSRTDTPTLPALLVRPMSLLPRWPARFALQQALNVVFADPLRAGDVDFLVGRHVNVHIDDAGIGFALSLRNKQLVVQPASSDPDLKISGKLWAFLQLASRAEDSDTLFFRRELSTTGDTDLGLYIKNFLDGLEPDTLPLHYLFLPLLRIGSRALKSFDAGVRRRFT